MSKPATPSDIARETLKRLAIQRIAPTPDHYEEIYNEISGVGKAGSVHPLAAQLLSTLKGLPRQTPELSRQIMQIEKAAQAAAWASVPDLFVVAIEAQAGQADLTRGWADLIRDLIAQWDLRSAFFSPARKSESLGKVLVNFGSHPALLNEKLDALIKSWAERKPEKESEPIVMVEDDPLPEAASVAEPIVMVEAASVKVAEPPAAAERVAPTQDWQQWRDILVKTLRLGLAKRLIDHPDLEEDAHSLAQAAQVVGSDEGLEFLYERLKRFWVQIEIKTEHDHRINAGLLNLVLLLSEHLVIFTGHDDWVQGQVALVQDLLAQPLNMRRIYDVEVAFREIVAKQGAVRGSLGEAQTALKSMVSVFVDRLGVMAESTVGYQEKMGRYAERIEHIEGIDDLSRLVTELMQDTRSLQLDIVRTHEEMTEARDKMQAAEHRIVELEQELRAVSEKVREDQLTGALNRRGFDEIFGVEIARGERTGKPLCVSLLDIDNFKKLNDSLGHQAGDEALIHLVAVVKDTLRPTDTVARYGGEEFLVLLPESSLSEAATVMRRVQRELTKRFFLHNNERVLITFSAGLTRYIPGERRDDAIDRADHAMYHAKKSGKNQVMIAEEMLKVE